MKKISKLSLLTLSILSSNTAFSYEVYDSLSLGIYGDAEYSNNEFNTKEDNTEIKSSTNAYINLNFKEKYTLMLDYNYQSLNLENDSIDKSEGIGNIYQAYAGYETQSVNLKMGRFANYNSKGYNSLFISDKLLTSTISNHNIIGDSRISFIDGASLAYIVPLEGGDFKTTIYGGINTQLSGTDSLDMEEENESSIVGANIDMNANGHRFLSGVKYSSYSDGLKSGDLEITDEVDKFTFYVTYQYESDRFFTDTTYRYDVLDTNEELEEDQSMPDQSIIDLKIGTKLYGFKPYIGYNEYEFTEDSNSTTISYGVRYDYKGLGFVLEKNEREFESEKENVISGKMFYNF